MTHEADIERIREGYVCADKRESAATVAFCILAGAVIVTGCVIGYVIGGALA